MIAGQPLPEPCRNMLHGMRYPYLAPAEYDPRCSQCRKVHSEEQRSVDGGEHD